MKSIVGTRVGKLSAAMGIAVAALGAVCDSAKAQRVLGMDVSRHQGQISQPNWNTAFSDAGGNRKFVFIRASRGGTTGEMHSGGGYPSGNNTFTSLSQRYDDPYFVQFINGATTAGMLAGPYHFGRADILSNTGTDEANHFIESAGAWMRPGYLLPTYDFEQVNGTRTDNQLAQFSVDFSNRIYEVTGIRPSIYTNGDHAANVLAQATNPTTSQIVAAFPNLWSARWPAGSGIPYPDANVQTEQPKDTYTNIYGPWDDSGTTHPWVFWQYSSGQAITGLTDTTVDGDVAQGDIEFVKDRLIPALWWKDSDGFYRDGDWNNLAKWNSGQTPVAPGASGVPYCGACNAGTFGQLTPTSTTLPIPRAAGDSGLGSTTGANDTVILDTGATNITVTHSSGTHSVRKLFAREALNITGGSLTMNYDPLYNFNVGNELYAQRSGPLSAQFSAAVSLSGTGSFNVHTLQVDATRTFTLGGGTLTFNTISLIPHATTPAKISVTGDVVINPFNTGNPRYDPIATIANGSGGGSTGFIDLSGGTRTWTVGNGPHDVDLQVNVPITNGGLIKAGAGTMVLGATNTFTGPVTVQGGTLRLSHSSGLSSSSLVTVNNTGRWEMNGVTDTIAGLASDVGHATGVMQQGTAALTLATSSGSNTYSGTITGTGILTKSGGGTQILTGNNSLGAVNMNGGTLLFHGINTTGTVTVNNGTLGGSGSVSGSVVANNSAHIAPGASTGMFTAGALTLNTGSVLDMELGNPFTSDLISVTGQLALLGGSVNVTNYNGELEYGTYTLIEYGTRIGSVANLGTPTGPAGFVFELVDTGNFINLQVSEPGINGDFNDDDLVDAADYVAWRKFEGVDFDLPNDGNLPGVLGPAEYGMWHGNFGPNGSTGGSPGPVPEPATAMLFVFGMMAFMAGVRRRS